jgi:protein-S-isoprenylcysteine O-methyltransferase Ste14
MEFSALLGKVGLLLLVVGILLFCVMTTKLISIIFCITGVVSFFVGMYMHYVINLNNLKDGKDNNN